MAKGDVAIQIVNYKTKAFLPVLIESIFKDVSALKRRVTINILDNASGDNLDDIAKKWKHQDLHVYYSDVNGGYGAGHNALAAKTDAEYLLLLNPDLLFIEQDTVERLLETMERTKAAVVGPRLLMPCKRTNTSLPGLSQAELRQQPWDHWKHVVEFYTPTNKIQEVRGVSGATFLIKRETLQKIGGFDEAFFLYYEETDLCDRLIKESQKVVYDPTITLIHYSSAVARKRSVYGLKALLRLEYKRLKGDYLMTASK